MSIAEQEELLDDICNDVLGYGPLEPLLARDDIADIMVNGAETTYIEVSGKIQLTNIRFRDNAQLMNICQRIVSQVGRRVDDSSPICDARLADGSRVNVIAPPLRSMGRRSPFVSSRRTSCASTSGQVQLDLARRRGDPRRSSAGCVATSSDLRRYRFGQDDAAELYDRGSSISMTTHHHLRGRGGTSIAAAPCGAAGNPAAQSGRHRRSHHARSGQELPAYAS
jgi:hypothetical protein